MSTTPEQVAIDRDFFAHLLTCLANQKFLHEMAGSLDGETRQQATDFQAIIDVAWRRGMDLLQSPGLKSGVSSPTFEEEEHA